MKILIAGLGSIGRRHLRNLIKLGNKNNIVYRTHLGTLTEENLPNVQLETDLGHALAQKPAGVIIANPTAKHMDIAIPAAEAGCTLLIEKPLSNEMDQIEGLANIVKEKTIGVLVGFQFRYHPGIQKAREWIADGAIGRPLSARCEWGEYLPGWHPWEDYRKAYSARNDLGGGVVLTLSHPLDYLHWLLGDVEEVIGITGKVSDLDLQVEDFAEIGMRFTSGAYAQVHLDYFRQPAEHRFTIVGTKGVVEWRNETGIARLYRNSTESWESSLLPCGFERNDLFLKEISHFINLVKQKEQSLCTLEDGIYNLKLCLAVHESSKTRKPVRIG